MLKRLLVVFLILCGFVVVTHAQLLSERLDANPQRPGAPSDVNSSEREMISRAVIKHEEASHRESLERAKESAQLGAEILDAFGRYKVLSREDVKKLERIEKLARKIRGRAGGSDAKVELKDPPRDLADGLKRLAEIAEDLRKNVEKTTRHVVSTTVIERSNELIELVRHIRTFTN